MQSPIHLPLLPGPRPFCTLCNLHTTGTKSIGIPTCFLPCSLPLSRESRCVLFLGRNPGYNEDRDGIPFVGKPGALVQDVYISGIQLHTLASIFVGNTARCYHVTGESPSNKHYKICREFLLPDLRILASLSSELIVVCLGAPATSHLYSLLGRPRVTLSSSFSHQGTRLPLPSLPEPAPSSPSKTSTILLYSTFHPADVLRTHNLIHAVSGHMQLLLNHLTGTSPVPSSPSLIPPAPPFDGRGKTPRSFPHAR